jgi:TetR/AcrR family transcriptional regulator
MNYLAERRQEEKERRRAEIIDAAEEVVGSAGWDALTMDQVARRARLSRALLYVYFKDKIDLMYGICERGLQLLRTRIDAVVGQHQLGLEQMVAVGRSYISFSQEFPVYFDIMARCELRGVNSVNAPANEVACQLTGDAIHATMVGVLSAGVRDGSIRADLGDPVVAAAVLWGFTHGVIQVAATRGKVLEHHGVDIAALLDQAVVMGARALAKP